MTRCWVPLGLVVLLSLSSPSASQIVEIVSPRIQGSGEFGAAISELPDVNGDGISETAIGAPHEKETLDGNPAEFENGVVHIFDGETQDLLYSIPFPASVTGASHETAFFGSQLYGLPDLDNDARGELLVGAPGAAALEDLRSGGRAFVFSGQDILFSFESSHPNNTGQFGTAVGIVPDVNQNGGIDFIIGARGEFSGNQPERAGKVYLFDGKIGDLIRIFDSPTPSENAEFGDTVCGIEDLNGNGTADIVVGAPRDVVDGKEDGRVYVIDGGTGELIYFLQSPNAVGNRGRAFFGVDVACVPDLNGDGFQDIAVGAYAESLPFRNSLSGAVYLFSGKTGELIHSTFPENLHGHEFFGGSISGLEDLNGDGLGDLVVGAYAEFDPTGEDSIGRAYLIDGHSGRIIQTFRSPNALEGGQYGRAVRGVGDLNGDGLFDFLVGAPYEFVEGSSRAGRVYLYLSPFNHRSDLNQDGWVNDLDLQILSADWHKVSGP